MLLQLRRSQIFQYHLAHAVPSVMPEYIQWNQIIFRFFACLFDLRLSLEAILCKEIEIVHRLSLVRISYCVGQCRVKQKRKQTKVFTNHVGGFVDTYSGSCNK